MRRTISTISSVCLTIAASALLTVPRPARAEGEGPLVRVPVPDDRGALAVFGAPTDNRVLVYLPGKCGNAMAPITAFPEAARAHGTLVVLEGDIPCPRSTRRRWGPDIAAIDRRVRAAVEAVSSTRRTSDASTVALDERRATVLGYSEGALRAESLARQFPERYPTAVILASPRKPSAGSFARSDRVAFVVGANDRKDEMREGADETHKAGRPSRFFLLPGATHGKYGPDGERVMNEVLDFVGSGVSVSVSPLPPSPSSRTPPR